MEVKIEPHTNIDKSFEVSTELFSVQVDFDDVNHKEVDAAILHLKEIIEKHWNHKP